MPSAIYRMVWVAGMLAAGSSVSAALAQTAVKSPDSSKSSADAGVADKAAAAMPLVLVLREEAVREQLRLTKEQATALDTLLAEVDYPLWYVRDAKDVETQSKCARAFDHLEKNLQTLLPAAQRARVDGILLQSHGWPTLLVPRFSAALALTADQQSRIRELLRPAADAPSATANEALSAVKQKQIKEVLDAAQQGKLSQLMGPAFSATRIRRRPCFAPEFVEVDQWFHSEPLDRRKLAGKVVAVHFWAFGCINCVRNLPHYKSWNEKYADRGLVVIGFHTPETQAERNIDSVGAKVKENGMRYPIAIDGAAKNWNAWATRWWPSVYLVDKRGYVRYWWYGELNWEGAQGEAFLRKKIEELLAETN
ncbi:MAG: hypothetical protein C0483_17190 [Pirellula sp.]|nr:hypothetical protein [Pirellula sp.]